jgi:hypothetical protein
VRGGESWTMMDPQYVRHIVDASAQNVLPLRPMMGSYVWLGTPICTPPPI